MQQGLGVLSRYRGLLRQEKGQCALDETGQALMKTVLAQAQLPARDSRRVRKPARTTADPAGSESITPAYLAEAIPFRPRLEMIEVAYG